MYSERFNLINFTFAEVNGGGGGCCQFLVLYNGLERVEYVVKGLMS